MNISVEFINVSKLESTLEQSATWVSLAISQCKLYSNLRWVTAYGNNRFITTALRYHIDTISYKSMREKRYITVEFRTNLEKSIWQLNNTYNCQERNTIIIDREYLLIAICCITMREVSYGSQCRRGVCGILCE